MQRTLREDPAGHDFSMVVGADVWKLYVYGVTRVGRELFVQTALFGPRTCTAVVHVNGRWTRRQAARQVLDVLRGWILSGDARDHVFLEAPDAATASC